MKYFLNEEVVEGKNLIEKGVPCGNFIAAYIHGIMLLCESNCGGIDNLLEIVIDEHGKHWLREPPCIKFQTFKHATKLLTVMQN